MALIKDFFEINSEGKHIGVRHINTTHIIEVKKMPNQNNTWIILSNDDEFQVREEPSIIIKYININK